MTRSNKIRIQETSLIYPLNSIDDKVNFLKSIRYFVKNTNTCVPNVFANNVCSSLGFPESISSDDPLDLKLSWNQIKDIQKEDGLLSFGGHSHTHPILSYLSEDDLKYELDTSISLMNKMADIKPIHYSYPEGLSHCYSDRVVNELRERGVRCCPTAISGTNSFNADPFELLRIMVA